jgi:cell division protein FtsL
VAYDNLAYSWEDADAEQARIEKRKLHKEQEMRAHRAKSVKFMMCALILAVMAAFMVSKYVAVYETGQEVEKLQKDLAVKQSYTSQKMFELEQSADLSTIEYEATTRLGMHRPEKTQIVYINVPKGNMTEKTADSVEAVSNRVARNFNRIKDFVVSIFTFN